MTFTFGMEFHSKKKNMQRKSNNVSHVSKSKITTNPNASSTLSLFSSPMIERVTNARSGCSACGK